MATAEDYPAHDQPLLSEKDSWKVIVTAIIAPVTFVILISVLIYLFH